MYAVFKTGGKQYRAATGDVIKVEKIEAEKGSTVELDQVLMVGEGEDVKIGTPYVDGSTVTATVKSAHINQKSIRFLFGRRRQLVATLPRWARYSSHLETASCRGGRLRPRFLAACGPG